MAHQLLNKELKNKLESHKKWLEEQINSQSYEAGGDFTLAQCEEDFYSIHRFGVLRKSRRRS